MVLTPVIERDFGVVAAESDFIELVTKPDAIS